MKAVVSVWIIECRGGGNVLQLPQARPELFDAVVYAAGRVPIHPQLWREQGVTEELTAEWSSPHHARALGLPWVQQYRAFRFA